MPSGKPRTEEQRQTRHKMLYGEDGEPPAERTGWNTPDEDRGGRPFGIPMTDDERLMRHKMLYGEESEPPAERIGRNPSSSDMTGKYPVIIGEEDGATRVVYVPQGEQIDTGDLEPITLSVIAAYILAHKVIAMVVIAGVAVLFYSGVTAMQLAYEKYARRGLAPFQLMVAAPKPEDINDPDSTYTLAVIGAVPGRKTMIKFGKAGAIKKALEPSFREGYGDFMVDVTARELAEAAAKRNFIIGAIPGLRDSGDVIVSMYAQEQRKPLMLDATTPIAPVKIHIPGIVEKAFGGVADIVPCFQPPKHVPITEADMGVSAGKRYYIKSSIPFVCCLPGLPYTPGMWLPPMCVISETM